MTRLTLHPPLEIGPRLLPAVSIGGDTHAWRYPNPGSPLAGGQPIRTCVRCGEREAYWDDDTYGKDTCPDSPAGRVSLDPSDLTWYVDLADGTSIEGGDFHHPWMHQTADEYVRGAMGALLSFLGAFAEAVEYEDRTGREGECSDLFPDELREWAYLNSDEIGLLAYDLENDDDD